MAKKYVRLSIDLTLDEYKELHRLTKSTCATKAAFVRKAIREKLDRIAEEHQKIIRSAVT